MPNPIIYRKIVTKIIVAQTSTKSGGTFANVDESGGVAWTTPSNASASDDVRTTSLMGAVDHTDYCKATNFGFTIPTQGVIDGIVVEVERRGTQATVVGITDKFIYLVKGGIDGGGTNNADIVTVWPTSDTYKTYGTSTDLWGQTWIPEDINASNFGCEVSALNVGWDIGDETASIDHIRITIYYRA